jgi:hypothetical protein
MTAERHNFDKQRNPGSENQLPAERYAEEAEIFSALAMETPAMHYEDIEKEADIVLEKYFPKEYDNFCKGNKPNLYQIINSFQESRIRFGREEQDSNTDVHTKEKFILPKGDRKGFVVAALIRYVDNFIDEQVWPHLHEYDPEVIRSEFRSFAREALQMFRGFDPNVPDSIARVLELEIELELESTQETFDTHCVELLQKKSYDMLYVSSLLGLADAKNIDSFDDRGWVEYESVACADYLRDFSVESRENDTDMNLALLLLRGKIFPHVLVAHLNDLEKRWHDTHPESEVKDGNVRARLSNIVRLRKSLCDIVPEYYSWDSE